MFDKRLLHMVSEAKRHIFASVALQWVALLANIVLFILIGRFLEGVLKGTAQTTSFGWLVLIGLVALFVRLLCQNRAQREGIAASAVAKRKVRQAVYDKLLALGPSYREHIGTSKAVQISVEGVEHLESYFGQYLPQLFYSVLAPLTLFVCLEPLCFPAALVLLLCVPLIPISIIAVQKIAKRVMRNYWGSYTDLGATFLESIQGLTTLKIFQADEARHKMMNAEAEGFRQATMRLLRMQLNSITVMDLCAYGGAAIGIAMVLWGYFTGQTGFGATFAIIFLSAEFFLPLRTLGSFFHTAMSGMAAADTMFELLETPEPADGTCAVDPALADISCEGVGYSYDGERIVLEGVDFHAPRGSFVGITGESGSGKSTLAGVFAGANANYTGTVRVGGVDLRDVSRDSLRQTITYVPFSSYLFKGSVRSNLLMAKPDASDEELWDALRRSRLDAFVRERGGLDSAVAAEGANLSGGQRQRLAMARALLRKTPIYLFDEATSNIDAESEAAIIAAIHELAKSCTVVMISHRLSALRGASCIYVFEDGHVVQKGTHGELAAQQGVYARLREKQSGLEEFADVAAGAADASAAGEPSDEGARGAFAAADVALALDLADEAETAPPAAHLGKQRSHWSVMLRLVKLTRPLLPVMLLAVVLGIGGFAAAIFLTVFATYGLLDLAGSSQGLACGAALIGVAACGIFRGPLRYGEQLCNHYLAFRILALVRDRVFAAMRKLAPAKLEGHDKGDLVSLVTSDVELLEVFYAHTLSPAVIALVVSVCMVAFIAFQSPLLACLAFASYALVGIVVPWVGSKASGEQGRVVRDEVGSMNTFVLDSLRGLSETLQFGCGPARSGELLQRMNHLLDSERPLKCRTASFGALTACLVMALDLLMLAAAFLLVQSDMLQFGPALISLAALMSSFGPVVAVANLGTTLQQTLASGARVLDLLDEQPCVVEVTDGVELGGFTGAELADVRFSYNQAPVLQGIDLRIQPGSIVRVSGRSGAGKSTLLKLLMRFWDVDGGSVSVSGVDVRKVNTASLRATEGFMTQETYLFDATIRENLLLAKPEASEEELKAALQAASLSDFVSRLAKGMDTPLGEVGDSLSGGERQRMGLARVFLHGAPFVLLDEPTSNLDSLNEAAVLRSLVQNREGKTIVLVSHRPSAAAIADVTYSVERCN